MTTEATGSGKRVLIVEDEYFVAKGLTRDLEALGARVVGPVPSVADALRLVASEPLDGAVLDLNLRGEQAFPVADALAARGVPFVLASGYAAETLPERFCAVPRCEKPVKAAEVFAVLFRPRP